MKNITKKILAAGILIAAISNAVSGLTRQARVFSTRADYFWASRPR